MHLRQRPAGRGLGRSRPERFGVQPVRVLIVGSGGQLATELSAAAPSSMELSLPPLSELNLLEPDTVKAVLEQQKPQVVINAAAYTAVDQAEQESSVAEGVNDTGVGTLVQACRRVGARLIHTSTDFVFDGRHHLPYTPEDEPRPISVYGKTKRGGELQVLGSAAPTDVVIRTAWLYSSKGNNFVKTMLRLMSERDSLAVVADQVGTPCWAAGLAQCIWAAVQRPETGGVFHWSDAGVASWYDFAVAIQELGLEQGLLQRPCELKPIPSSAYPTPASRPAFSVLDKSKTYEQFELEPTHWREQLRRALSNW